MDILKAIDIMLEQAKADYKNWKNLRPGIPEISESMIKEFNDSFVIKDSPRQKFIKIVRKEKNGSQSVWGFINKKDFKHFKRGDILKAQSFRAPALNQPRGNIFVPGYKVSWTGPHYL